MKFELAGKEYELRLTYGKIRRLCRFSDLGVIEILRRISLIDISLLAMVFYEAIEGDRRDLKLSDIEKAMDKQADACVDATEWQNWNAKLIRFATDELQRLKIMETPEWEKEKNGSMADGGSGKVS